MEKSELTHVRNKGDYCVLCCLSSFLQDNGQIISPQQMMSEHPEICRVNSEKPGAIDLNDLKILAQKYYVVVENLPSNYLLRPEDEDGSVFIGISQENKDSTKSIRHIQRFRKLEDNNKISVMDPDENTDWVYSPENWANDKLVTYLKVKYSPPA